MPRFLLTIKDTIVRTYTKEVEANDWEEAEHEAYYNSDVNDGSWDEEGEYTSWTVDSEEVK